VHLCEGTNIQNAYRFGFNTNSRAGNLPFYRYTFKTFFNSDPGSGNTDEALALISDATFNSQCIGAIIQPYYNETRSTYIGNITGGLSLMLGTNYNPNIFIDGSTNHVGIGTTEPEQPLDVAGIAQAHRLRAITAGTGPNDGYVDIGRADKFWSIKQRNANGGGTDDLRFQNSDNGTWGPVLLSLRNDNTVTAGVNGALQVNANGQVIVNNAIPTVASGFNNAAFAVNGTGAFREVVVLSPTKWPDYVFDESYELMSLNEVSSFIKKNKHLPGVPSRKEVVDGIKTSEMIKILLEKIEELTLHAIRQEAEIEKLRKSFTNTGN
jgi:hypothetical protein